MNRSLHNNIRTIYLMGFCHSFMVVIPVFVPLLQGYGLSMSQVLQTQALFALTIAMCEVPSGYIADMWGRRQAILIGSALNALGFFSLLWADSFLDFLVYEVILGVGFSLISGADLALLYDTEVYLQERGLPGGAGAGKSLSRLIAVEAAASGIAGVVASILLLWSLDGVVLVQAFTGLLPLLLGLTLLEVPRPTTGISHRDNARNIVGLLLFGKPVVLWTAFAIIVFGLLAIYVFWIYQKYWELQGVPLGWFGYIWAAFALTVSVSARYASALEHRLGTRKLLYIIAALPLLGLAGMPCQSLVSVSCLGIFEATPHHVGAGRCAGPQNFVSQRRDPPLFVFTTKLEGVTHAAHHAQMGSRIRDREDETTRVGGGVIPQNIDQDRAQIVNRPRDLLEPGDDLFDVVNSGR